MKINKDQVEPKRKLLDGKASVSYGYGMKTLLHMVIFIDDIYVI